jgi:hypothetical protein
MIKTSTDITRKGNWIISNILLEVLKSNTLLAVDAYFITYNILLLTNHIMLHPGSERDMWAPQQASNLVPLQINILSSFVQHLFIGGEQKLIFY